MMTVAVAGLDSEGVPGAAIHDAERVGTQLSVLAEDSGWSLSGSASGRYSIAMGHLSNEALPSVQ